MMKLNAIEELVKGTHNDTKHQNSAHPKPVPYTVMGAADQYTMSPSTHIHFMIQRILNYTIETYNWNQAGNNNNIALSDTPSWPIQLLVCICLLEREFDLILLVKEQLLHSCLACHDILLSIRYSDLS